ncbi:hypothetical protein IQ235_00980 [Oscillatoriales cyanobacterium LEGE 11467]|uniref:Uncharacterized protein n=1 Tax=Zarconia navalis LEGE 11467 TaxID=1828826 RepID=A0A928Z7G0_9CYAN|nr:hypothetical protein [Zarconia navalis]MBE9039369.1 hypothetical protein [Zarconia navalis LEGE 11467]
MNEYPEGLMPALAEVREGNYCNMLSRSCVIEVLETMGEQEIADWLTQNRAGYSKLINEDFSEWLDRNPSPGKESLAQKVAKETGLEAIAD